MKIRNHIGLLIAALIAFALLCSLGVWQVRRLQWKEGLIAQLTQRMAQPAQPLADTLPEYTKVALHGALDTAHPLYRIGQYQDGPGFEVIAPFKMDDGRSVLVDLGAVPSRGPLKPVTDITGIIRLHNQGKGLFDPANNVAENRWYWWDIPAMQAAANMLPAPPLIVQALANTSGAAAAPPQVELANNHLGYAITWFGLAAALAGVTTAFVLRRKDG